MNQQHWSTLQKYFLTPNLHYLLDCYRNKIVPSKTLINEEAELADGIRKGFLKEDGTLTHEAIVALDDMDLFSVKTKKKVTIDILGENSLAYVKEYREIFPNCVLASGLTGRSTVLDVQTRFVWFFRTYPEFSWDLVLDAATYYNKEQEKKGQQYMQNAMYFIQKTDPKTKVTTSSLASYCQLILDNPAVLNEYM